ncbi:MAG TPA: metallophosphoesterase [Thermodesulfobacteriota bacterium]
MTLEVRPVPAPRISRALGAELRVLHVSDLHVRGMGRRERRLVHLARAARPDLVAITGDLWEPSDDPGTARAALTAVVRALAALAPTVVVLGNNDHSYPPAGHVVDTETLVTDVARAGAMVLRNEAAWLARRAGPGAAPADGVYLVGLDDNYLARDDLEAATASVGVGAPAILLAHSPDIVIDRDVSRFDLVLAGHTHGGQVRLPLVGALETQTRTPRYVDGLFRLPSGTYLHVSAGIGTSAPHVRFLARPTVTLLRLVEG